MKNKHNAKKLQSTNKISEIVIFNLNNQFCRRFKCKLNMCIIFRYYPYFQF